MSTFSQPAPAKINLTLHVVGIRPDGFHELESLVARLALHDTVRVEPRTDGRHTVSCDTPGVPCDERNLVVRAANALAAAAGGSRGVHITLEKRIPPGSGLGGGSSNAAATLRLLNELWQLDLPTARLAEIGASIGSDVPLFLADTPLSILRGRGERIEPVPRRLGARVLLLLSDIHCATPAVFEAWDRHPTASARASLEAALSRLDDACALADALANDLEAPARAVSPELDALAERFRALAAPWPVTMSGSGSTYFLLDTPEGARISAMRRRVEPLGLPVRLVETELELPG